MQMKALKKITKKTEEEIKAKEERYQIAISDLSDFEKLLVNNLLHHRFSKSSSVIKRRHAKKLDILSISKNEPAKRPVGKPTLTNLSSHSLSQEEAEILSLGFSMCWPSKVNIHLEKAEAESVFYQLRKSSAISDVGDAIAKIRGIFRSYYSKNRNLKRQWLGNIKSLINLSKNTDLYISKADKGSNIVVDDKSNYLRKMSRIVEDETKFRKYEASQRSDKHPFILEEDRLNRQLLKMTNDA